MDNITQEPKPVHTHKLSDEQIDKITLTIIKVSEKLKNGVMYTLAHNLKQSKTIDEKRKWIVLFYANCYQILSFVNMARDDKRAINDYEVELKKLVRDVQ